MEFLLEWKWMLAPLLACLILSITHVYFGIHVVARKVIFVDLALAQIAALGATYATTLGYDANAVGDHSAVTMFSLVFTFVGAGLFAIARMRKERVPQEAFIGIVYAAASATAILILSKSPTGGEELKHMLVGEVLLVSMPTIIFDSVLYSLVLIFHVIFRRKFLAISMDAEAAQASAGHATSGAFGRSASHGDWLTDVTGDGQCPRVTVTRHRLCERGDSESSRPA